MNRQPRRPASQTKAITAALPKGVRVVQSYETRIFGATNGKGRCYRVAGRKAEPVVIIRHYAYSSGEAWEVGGTEVDDFDAAIATVARMYPR